MAKKARRIVPFKRTLRRGDNGQDVVAVKRALVKAKCLKHREGHELSRSYGPGCTEGVKRFQRLARLQIDGVYGRQTHRRLMPYFDPYGAWLMGRAPSQAAPGVTLRGKIVNEAIWAYNMRDQYWYAQVRPMQSLHKGHVVPQTLDCSEFVTVSYFRAGAPDPNSMQFNGFGYTGTLSQHGHQVTLGAAQPADVVLYGSRWPWEHTAIYVGNGKVISMGSDAGPLLLPINYRSDWRVIRSYL